jgi:hypothetical protein
MAALRSPLRPLALKVLALVAGLPAHTAAGGRVAHDSPLAEGRIASRARAAKDNRLNGCNGRRPWRGRGRLGWPRVELARAPRGPSSGTEGH